jgi:hypothetical protein
VGFEPTRPCGHGILSAASLPFLHSGLTETIAPPGGDNPPSVDLAGRIELIRKLCSFEGRLTGTDAERRAASFLAGHMRGWGRRADVEPTYVHPEWSLILALHVLLAVVGSVAAIAVPPLGFALVLVAAASYYWDVQARFYLLRRLFFRRASQNVVSLGKRPGAPARLILCAHYDAARTGWLFRPRALERSARLWRLLPGGNILGLLFFAIAALLPILGARMAGVEAEWLSLLQLLPTVVLIVSLLPLLDIALSDVVPAANDNASGVATALSLAEELDRAELEIDLWVLLTGAEECVAEGMRAFVRSHRDELDPESTYFLNIDTVGYGTVRYITAEGPILTYPMAPRLVELAEAVAAADRERGGDYDARAWRHPLLTDALPAVTRGYPAISLRCLDDRDLVTTYHNKTDTPDRIDPVALERVHGFALELIRALDRDVGRRSAAAAVV